MPVPKISEYRKSCMNCYWFDFNREKRDAFGGRIKALNRECLYDGKVDTKRGVCLMWRDTRTPEQVENGELVMKGFC